VFAMRLWTILLFVFALFLLSGKIQAQMSEDFASAEEVITHAEALGAHNDYDGAIKLLTTAVARFPTYARMYLALANWQEMRGLQEIVAHDNDANERKTLLYQHLNDYPETAQALFETLGRATMFLKDTQPIQQHINELTRQEFPTLLGEYGPLALPGNPVPSVFTINDPQLPVGKRGTYQGLITSTPLSVIPADTDDLQPGVRAKYATDPEFGNNTDYAHDAKFGNWRFHNILYAYDYDAAHHCWHLRFRVIWQNVRGQQDTRARFARQCAQLLLHLYGLLRAYTDLTPRFATDGAINVWLAEKGEAGGEAFNENIYLQEIGVNRAPTEWVRELAHEFGHETLPVVGGYVKPEWASNGILGERLYLRWLLLNVDPGETQPWIKALNSTLMKESRINRYIRQFAALGPDAPQMLETDSAAMDAFTGMALYLDETFGSAPLTSVLKMMTTPAYSGQNGFCQSVEAQACIQQSIAQPTVILRLPELPAHIPYWAYLTAGIWQGTVETRNGATLAVKIEVDGKETLLDLNGHFMTVNLCKGWHQFHLAPDDKVPDDLVSLKLVRQ